LAAVSGRASDAAGVRIDFAKDLGVVPADWIGRGGREENRLKEGGRDGEVSEKSFAMSPCGLFSYREEAELAPSTPAIGVARDEKLPKAGTSGGGWLYNARYEKPKRKFRSRPVLTKIRDTHQRRSFRMKPKHQEYEGHRIELREREGKPELLIDKAPVRYGQLPSGKYFLQKYAYDWSDDLIEVARRFIKYRDRAEKIRETASSKGGK
jgi:hypothetical protein